VPAASGSALAVVPALLATPPSTPWAATLAPAAARVSAPVASLVVLALVLTLIFAPELVTALPPALECRLPPAWDPSPAPAFVPVFAPAVVPTLASALVPAFEPAVAPALASAFVPILTRALALTWLPSVAPPRRGCFGVASDPSPGNARRGGSGGRREDAPAGVLVPLLPRAESESAGESDADAPLLTEAGAAATWCVVTAEAATAVGDSSREERPPGSAGVEGRERVVRDICVGGRAAGDGAPLATGSVEAVDWCVVAVEAAAIHGFPSEAAPPPVGGGDEGRDSAVRDRRFGGRDEEGAALAGAAAKPVVEAVGDVDAGSVPPEATR